MIALHLELDLLVAARLGGRHVHRLGPPALGGGESLVHLVQVARENGRLIAAGGRTDLLVGRIGRNEHELDVLLQLRQALLYARDLLLGELLHIGIVEHLLGRGQVVGRLHVLAGPLGKRPLVGVLLGQAVVFFLVGEDGRIAHLGLQLLVGFDDLDQLLAHVGVLHGSCCPS